MEQTKFSALKGGLRGVFAAVIIAVFVFSCKPEIQKEYIIEPCPEDEKPSAAALKSKLTEGGFQIFDYVDPESRDTIIMQQYYMAFLKAGPNRSQNQAEADSLQKLHLEHLSTMYAKGYADISGPFGDDGEIRGVTIYNVPTLQMADSLANMDPMVRAGRLEIEIHPWWAAKGYPLR